MRYLLLKRSLHKIPHGILADRVLPAFKTLGFYLKKVPDHSIFRLKKISYR